MGYICTLCSCVMAIVGVAVVFIAFRLIHLYINRTYTHTCRSVAF